MSKHDIHKNTSTPMQRKVGFALSGGGARAIMHLGVIQAAREHNVDIVAFSACSMGAVLAALIAAGHEPEDILSLFTEQKIQRHIRPSFRLLGRPSLEPFLHRLSPMLPDTFEGLRIPLTVNASNLESAESISFSSGPLLAVLQASCSVPLVFQGVKINGIRLYDGGILDNLPIGGLPEDATVEHWASASNATEPQAVKGAVSLIERSLRLAINQNTLLHRSNCDLIVEPLEMGAFRMGDFGRAREIFDVGYQSMDEILRLRATGTSLD